MAPQLSTGPTTPTRNGRRSGARRVRRRALVAALPLALLVVVTARRHRSETGSTR